MRRGDRFCGAAGRRILSATAGMAALAAAAGIASAAPLSLGLRILPASSVQPPAEPAPENQQSPAPPEASPPGDRPARPDAANPLNDPQVEEIIGDLERATAPRRPVEPVTPAAAAPARPSVGVVPGVRPLPRGEAAGQLLPDGTFLPLRRGRVIRGEAGEWAFHFDTDPDSAAPPPMVLLPCQTLMAIEGYAMRGGEAVVLRVSGQVFMYYGRNYLLPTHFEPERRSGDLIPLQ